MKRMQLLLLLLVPLLPFPFCPVAPAITLLILKLATVPINAPR